MIVLDTRPRTFLFLQGLASSFFDKLGQTLRARGHNVLRVNLNAGDWLFWRQPGAFNYRGTPQAWPAWIAALMAEHDVTDLILFGDCRPMHRTAIDAAGDLRVAVHVCEEGYLRPDWVTIELGGVNGHSSLPRDAGWYREQAKRLPAVEPIPTIRSSFRRRATEDIAYNFSAMLLSFLYPHYRTHRPWHPMVEYIGWAARLMRKPASRRRSARQAERLVPSPGGTRADYYLFPLQLDCDSQIRLHSSFTGILSAIERVLHSFAAAAPVDSLLVVKEHPLDNGLTNWRRRTVALAERLGIQDRLVYLEHGDIAHLVRSAAGVVTVNSTTGTLALASGVPVITLGNAIYDLQGLTFQDDLDKFWTRRTPPDADLFDAFRRVLVHRCLVRGGFFSDEGIGLLIGNAVVRLEAVTPAPAQRGRARAVPDAKQAFPAPGTAAALRQ